MTRTRAVSLRLVANGVGDQPELGGKLSGNDAVVALIPIEDDALLLTAGDHVFVDDDRSSPGRESRPEVS